MATNRGFVQQIEIGRASLVRVSLIHVDGSSGDYVIPDLDADPERFNERLSKLGVLRDAMTRAELVEIEFSASEAGRVIDRAVRISRDALAPPKQFDDVSGFVAVVAVQCINAGNGPTEVPDTARVTLLDLDLQPRQFVLNLQAPERAVAQAQLQMLRDAQAAGRVVQLQVDAATQPNAIVTVAVGGSIGKQVDPKRLLEFDGFIESLALMQFPSATGSGLNSLAVLGMTTAPGFSGPGNTVPLTPFAPSQLKLLVPYPSTTYDLFEAGLRDNLRMHVVALTRAAAIPNTDDNPNTVDKPAPPAAADWALREKYSRFAVDSSNVDGPTEIALVVGAELFAPLASASRPVWIHISRESLDRGPDCIPCIAGTPTSDLTPQTLRDLRLPYRAAWKGMGCFNEGVYRFEIKVETTFELRVDGKVSCLYDTPDPHTKLAYACLCSHHCIEVELDGWTCDKVFALDVYRVR